VGPTLTSCGNYGADYGGVGPQVSYLQTGRRDLNPRPPEPHANR
jgi:hypothetical protein